MNGIENFEQRTRVKVIDCLSQVEGFRKCLVGFPRQVEGKIDKQVEAVAAECIQDIK